MFFFIFAKFFLRSKKHIAKSVTNNENDKNNVHQQIQILKGVRKEKL